MALPQAIQNQIDRADQLVSSFSEVPSEGDTQVAISQPPQPVQQPAVPISQVQQPAQHTENFEARFHSLRGKYDAEVPRLAQQVREQTAAIQTLIAENQTLKHRTEQVQQQPLVTDADKQAFGDDLVDMVDRVAKQNSQAVEYRLEQLKRENEQLKGQIGNVNEQVAVGVKDRFLQQLTAAVPDWQAVNTDHGFLVWLGETDPVYGLPRQAGLTNAYDQLDAARTARIFETYKQLSGQSTPAKTPRQELQSQVAPTRSRNTATPATDTATTRIWTQAEIAAFYSDQRRGNLTDDAAARMELELQAAVTEGRVR